MKKAKLEEKLKELGYKKNIFGYYQKQNIQILIDKNQNKIFEKGCYVEIIKEVRNRNDIQFVKNNIEKYDKQLKIMRKDINILKEVFEDDR